MKKLLFVALLAFNSVSAQEKESKDTVITVSMSINQFRALMYTIDLNIDSKKLSKEILEFLQQNAKLLTPPAEPADKPKVSTAPKKN